MPVQTTDSSIDLVFGACADPTRLRILNLLSDGTELCVCDVIAVLGEPQAKISRHLAVLRNAGLVAQRIDRTWRHYRLAEPGDEFHQKLIDCLRACAAVDGTLAADLKSLANATCCAPGEDQVVQLNIKKR